MEWRQMSWHRHPGGLEPEWWVYSRDSCWISLAFPEWTRFESSWEVSSFCFWCCLLLDNSRKRGKWLDLDRSSLTNEQSGLITPEEEQMAYRVQELSEPG